MKNSLVKSNDTPEMGMFNNFSNAMNHFLEDFGFRSIEKDFEDAQKMLDESLATLEKRIKKTKHGFTVTVPYDRSKETLRTSIDDGVLTVIVKSEDGTSVQTTSFTLPSNFNTNLVSVNRQYDDEKKEMHLHFSLRKEKKNGKKE